MYSFLSFRGLIKKNIASRYFCKGWLWDRDLTRSRVRKGQEDKGISIHQVLVPATQSSVNREIHYTKGETETLRLSYSSRVVEAGSVVMPQCTFSYSLCIVSLMSTSKTLRMPRLLCYMGAKPTLRLGPSSGLPGTSTLCPRKDRQQSLFCCGKAQMAHLQLLLAMPGSLTSRLCQAKN